MRTFYYLWRSPCLTCGAYDRPIRLPRAVGAAMGWARRGFMRIGTEIERGREAPAPPIRVQIEGRDGPLAQAVVQCRNEPGEEVRYVVFVPMSWVEPRRRWIIAGTVRVGAGETGDAGSTEPTFVSRRRWR